MAAATATISHTHGHGLPTKPHTDSPLLSFTNLAMFTNPKRHSTLTSFKSFHVKLGSPIETITPVDDEGQTIDRKPRITSPRTGRSHGITAFTKQSPRARTQKRSVKPRSPMPQPNMPPASSPVLKATVVPAQLAVKPKMPVKPVLAAAVAAHKKATMAATYLPTAPSFTITPVEVVHRYIQDEWGPYELGEVRGPPTRGHWRPDDTASCCAYPTCTVVFGLMNRRHHCRRCGDIYCQMHSINTVPLDHEARIHANGNPERACESCFEDYQIWKHARQSRTSSMASAICPKPQPVSPLSAEGPATTPMTPVGVYPEWQATQPTGTAQGLNPLLNGSSGSAPANSAMQNNSAAYIDLNWSTF